MRKFHLMKTVCAVGLAVTCIGGLAACSSDQTTSTGSVAATVNGTDIAEDTVTNYIEHIRMQLGTTDEDTWGEWLATNSYTPQTVREEIIDVFVQRTLVSNEADARGLTVDSSEVDEALDSVKQQYETDEKWQAALDAVGMTEDEYRGEIEMNLKASKLQDSFAQDVSDEDMLNYAQMYASTYDGAKRSSHILFESEDEATAQEVLDKINAGELDFAEAAKEYSVDTGSAEEGGDVGWDAMSSFVEEYTNALAELDKDQVSGLVTSDYGIHIIKCTDVYDAPKTTGEDGTETVEVTSLDQIPTEWQDSIRESVASMQEQEAYQAWLTEAEENATITINDMPSGLPYDVDMSKYQTNTTVTNDDGSTTTTKTDGTVVTINTDGSISATYSDGTSAEVNAERTTVQMYSAEGEMTEELTGDDAQTTISALLDGIDTATDSTTDGTTTDTTTQDATTDGSTEDTSASETDTQDATSEDSSSAEQPAEAA